MRKFAFILLPVFLSAFAQAQKIQYSRGTAHSSFADAVHLVADVEGYHHLLFLNVNKKPVVYIFDARLQLVNKEEIDVKLKKNTEVQVLPLGKRYLLYLHAPGSKAHQLFSVEGSGEATDLSYAFSNAADSAWNRSTATFQLFNKNNKLCLLTHTYFHTLKKISSRIVWFNDDLLPARVQNVSFPLAGESESLQQIFLLGDDLFVLKTRREDNENFLDVLKIEAATGEAIINSFSSGSHFYAAPGMRFSAADSSIFVYSLMHESFPGSRLPRPVFISQLDYSLREKVPPAVLQSQFRNNAATFFLLNTSVPRWLSLLTTVQIRKSEGRFANPQVFDMEDVTIFNVATSRTPGFERTLKYNVPASVHFRVLDENFKPVKDSVVANGGSYDDVQPQPFAQFQTGDKACLLLIENFSPKKRGLLLLKNDPQGGLSTTSLPVFDRYEYHLPQLQPLAKESFIVPYSYKNEFGLVKISFSE